MSFLVCGIRGRLFTALWLLLYAAAGLLVHSSLGHNHLHLPAMATQATAAGEEAAPQHTHAGHDANCPFHHHHAPSAGHSHSLADRDCDSACQHEHADHDHSHHHHSDHEDCAGCKLLGSISTPALAVVLEESGWLICAAPILEVSHCPVFATGVHLARAPPVA